MFLFSEAFILLIVPSMRWTRRVYEIPGEAFAVMEYQETHLWNTWPDAFTRQLCVLVSLDVCSLESGAISTLVDFDLSLAGERLMQSRCWFRSTFARWRAAQSRYWFWLAGVSE